MHFYMRNAKKEDIDKFKKEKKLKHLGMPIFIGSGSHDIEGLKHRFLVMPRYGQDIWKIFLEQNRIFPLHTVYRLGIQLIDVLEYIHKSTYVHMDLKGSNILLGFGRNGDEHIFLMDYGLATHYNTKVYKVDPKRAHNGTIEYTSRDAHNGVPTMRGDIEILAYNLIEWAGAKLPWTTPASLLTKPAEVQKLKEKFMSDIDSSVKTAFGSTLVPSQLGAFMKYVAKINNDTVPDYSKIRGMFESGLKELKASNSGKLEFSIKSALSLKSPSKRPPIAPKNNPSPVKKAKIDPGPSKATTTKKQPAIASAKSKVLVADSDDENTEEEPVERSKRARKPARYMDSDDDIEVIPSPKKPSTSKSKDKSENKSSNSTPPKKKKSENTAKGKLIFKSKSSATPSGSKKTIALNFDLDISYDSDLIVTVNRKDKKKKNETEKGNAGEDDDDNANRAGYYNGKFAKS